MSTPDPTPAEPTPAPAVSKNKRKKTAAAAAKPVVIESIEDEPVFEPEAAYRPPDVYIEEGFSGWTLLRGVLSGFAAGGVAVTLLFGYLRAKEIQRAQQDLAIALQEQAAVDQQRSKPLDSTAPPSSDV